MKLLLTAVGKTAAPYLRTGIDLYLARLSRYLPVEVAILPDIKRTASLSEVRQKELEGQQLLNSLQGGDFLLLLDENGREYTSLQWADYMQRRMASGIKRLVVAVGGPYGFSPQVYSRADDKVSLSRMTFNHEMVRLFFVEQAYRAMTILRGEPYHHQ